MFQIETKKIYTGPLILLAYGALACVITWPLVTQISTHLEESTDSLLHYWNGWWVQRALTSGSSPFYTSYLFYPQGASLVTHNSAWLNALPWSVLEPLLGGILAYNAIVLLNLALCGYSAFLLTYRLTCDPRAAFIAGLIYQAWPYRIAQLAFINLTSTQWIPFFFLGLVCTIRTGRWRNGVLCGICFALVGYTRWQLLIPTTIMGLIYFACSAAHWSPKGRRYVLVRLLVAGGIAALLLLFPLLLLLNQQGDGVHSGELVYQEDEKHMQADVLAYVTPSQLHPLLGKYTRPLYNRYYSDRALGRRYPAYVGFTTLLLALWGIKSRWREALPWVLMAAVLIALALGPILRVNGRLLEFPTPYRLLSPLVFVRLMRIPERFNMFLALPIGVLAALGIGSAWGRKPKAWQAVLTGGVLCGVILFEYLIVPIPMLRPSSYDTSFYRQIASEPGDLAVVNLPFNVNEARKFMFDQTLHHRPILQGNLSRRYEGLYDYIDDNPLLRVLRRVNEMPPYLTDVSRQLAALNQDGIRYIIAHKTGVGEDRIAHWGQYLLIEPCYQDERVIIYRTAPQAGRDFALKEELVPGLGPIDVLVSADCLTLGHVLQVDVGWGSAKPIDRDLDVALSLVDSTGVAHQTERYPLSDGWPTGQWPAHAIAWGHYAFRVSSSLRTGDYTVTLALLDAETGHTVGHPLAIRSVTVRSDICNLAVEPGAQDVNALFGDVLRLLEYEANQEGGSLHLTLYWHLERRMEIDYKVFVHVADPATGIPVAQNDSMPHQGAYPTTFWWPGEIVKDRIGIPLQGVPAGTYDIAVGLYEGTTGERLPLRDARGRRIEDGRLILDAQVVQ